MGRADVHCRSARADFLFVYAQLPEKEEKHRALIGASASTRSWPHLGTATLAALFYFQFEPEWVVTAYAAIAFALFAAALLLDRAIFLHQAILLTLGTLARGMAHNLFGSGYFTGRTWNGRFLVVGSAVAILLATLSFAFPLRGRYAVPPNASPWRKVASALVARPEQLQFFAPIVLLTVMLALKMKESMVTVSWGIEGVFIIILALAFRERSFLRAGFAILLLSVAKVFAMDIWRLDLLHGTIAWRIGYRIVGVALGIVSVLYATVQRQRFSRYL